MLAREAASAKLTTALRRWGEFVAAVGGSSFVPFVAATVSGDIAASAHNEQTLGMFAEHMRQAGSRARGMGGQAIRAETVAQHVSQIRTYCSIVGGQRLVGEGMRLASAAKRMRIEDGPAMDKKLRRGLRARHLRMALDRGFDILSWWGVMRWAILRTGLSALARGADLSRPADKVFDPVRGLCLAHVQWVPASEYNSRYSVVVLWLVPSKDPSARKKRMPVPIRRRLPDGQRDGPGACTYEAIAAAWRLRVAAARRDEWGSTAFFCGPAGESLHTGGVRQAVRCAAEAAGEPAGEFGGHSLRIGGATDYLDFYGPIKAPPLIKQRGRWGSDIGEIYSRASASLQVDASVDVWDAQGVELEALVVGWGRSRGFDEPTGG